MNNQTQTKTHWKKNNDSAYISGDDLKAGLKGLKPEMIVELVSFVDGQSFDQSKSAKIIVSSLQFREVGGKDLYKPVILNKTNAKIFVKEFGSEYMEDWIGKPITMYAQADSRHGYVVRFRKFNPPILVLNSDNFKACKKAYEADPSMLSKIKMKYSLTAEVEAALIAKP